jgi:ankyrin repeat protein
MLVSCATVDVYHLNNKLIQAVKNDNLSDVSTALADGASVNTAVYDVNYQRTALMIASEKGYEDIVKMLLDKKADVNQRGDEGQTALMIASGNGHIEIVNLLLNKKVDVNQKGSYGQTALMIASEKGHEDVVRLLIDKGADLDLKEIGGKTALIAASHEGHTDIVKFLIDKGADVNAKDQHGGTALSIELQKGHQDIIKLLIEKGADVNTNVINVGPALIIELQKGHEDIVKMLLDKGADVNTTYDGHTALWMESQKGHTENVKLLLDKGADVNAHIPNDSKDDLFMQGLLIEVDSTENKVQTYHGATALWIAAYNGHADIVKLLIDKGADVNAKAIIKEVNYNEKVYIAGSSPSNGEHKLDRVEKTALRIALNRGHTDIAQMLKKAGAKE